MEFSIIEITILIQEIIETYDLLERNAAGSRTINAKKGIFQADILIAKLFLNDSVSAIVSNDGKFMMHTGSKSN